MNDQQIIALNLKTKAPSQYLNYECNSAVEFNGKLVMFTPDGIFEEGGQTDNGTEIDAWIDTPVLDLGNRQQKTIEAFDIGFEATDNLRLTLYGDEVCETAREFILTPVKDSGRQQDGMQTLRKYKHGSARYWKVRIANTFGCDFSIDYLALAPVFLKRRPL